MLVFRLALRALRWRSAAAASVFAVALIAVLAATVGPIYLHALDETVLSTHLQRASDFRRDVLVSRTSALGYGVNDWDTQVRTLANQVAASPLFASPVASEQAKADYEGPSNIEGQFAAIDDLCAHVHIVAGRCLAGDAPDDTLISTNTASSEHLGVGSAFVGSITTNGAIVRLHVVGVYRPIAPDGAFWAPWGFFLAGQPPSQNGLPPADASFVTHAALAARSRKFEQTFAASVQLVSARFAYDDIAAVRALLHSATASAARLAFAAGSTGTPTATVSTALPGVVSAATRETSLARTLVTVATVQLALLAIFVLYTVVSNTAGAQGPEIALAKLRGRRTRSVLLQSVAQPTVLVVAATPVAALLAWVLVRLLAAHLLGHPVDVVFPPAAYGVAALAALGGILAALVAARRIVVAPVGVLLRRGAEVTRSSVGLLGADVTAVTLAVAGLIELKVGGVLDGTSPNPLAVLAPTLLAIAGAVVVLRLLPFAGRRLARWTRDSSRLATFLAVRQLLRRPAEARALLLVAVALAIAAFAVTNWSEAGHNRALRALNSAGADTVLIVRPGAGVHDLRTAVDRADPSGQAMAVAHTYADQLPPLIAVDTARFAAVAAWVPGNTSAPLPSVLHRLVQGRVAPLVVTGSRLRLSIDLREHPEQPVRLAISVTEPDHDVAVRTIARIAPGSADYAVALPSSCTHGCSLTNLHLAANTQESDSSDVIDAVLGASAVGVHGTHPIEGFGQATRWRGVGNGRVRIRSVGSSLEVDALQIAGSAPWPSAESASSPATLPGVIASGTAERYEGNQIHSVVAVGLDGQTVSVDGVIRSLALPQIDRAGMLVDYESALASTTGLRRRDDTVPGVALAVRTVGHGRPARAAARPRRAHDPGRDLSHGAG